ncbi:MAG: ribose-phosphate diphosphokinase [bacterium]
MEQTEQPKIFVEKRVLIVPGRNSADLAARIADASGYPLAKIEWTNFSDGETKPQYQDNIRGATLYIVNSTNAPASNLYDLLLLTDAAVRASAEKVIAVIPYFGGQRQERKDKGRVPITAMLNVKLLEAAGVNKIIAMDLHADAIQAFFPRFDHIYASAFFVPVIKNLGLENLIFASPDINGGKRAEKYALYFKLGIAVCWKRRKDGVDQVEVTSLFGKVKGKNVVVFDDILDTAGSLEGCVNLLVKAKAKTITVIVTHPMLSGKAYERIVNMPNVKCIVSDSLPLKEKFLTLQNIEVISSHPLLGEVIRRDVNNESISTLFAF